jgi:rhamnose transport system permease protein
VTSDAARTATRTPLPPDPATTEKRSPLRALVRWESALVLVLVATLVFGSATSDHFLQVTNVFYIGLNMGEIAIMALPLMLIIITAEIDLSVASMLGLSGAVMGALFSAGWSVWAAMGVSLLVGLAGGALNGLLVAKLGLPSIAVTIGTLTLFRDRVGAAHGHRFPVVPDQHRRHPAARH